MYIYINLVLLIVEDKMKIYLRKIFILISKVTVGLFYNKKYLKGKHFDNNVIGWIWCWKNLFMQKIIGYNRNCPFPVSFRNEIGNWRNLEFNLNDMNNFQHFGVYFQTWRGKIYLGEGTYIAPNVGLITQNHNLENLNEHDTAEDIYLGKSCWVGMNSVILPGIKLGDNTIVAAGAVVTKSFPEGNCVIGGVPAKLIKKL